MSRTLPSSSAPTPMAADHSSQSHPVGGVYRNAPSSFAASSSAASTNITSSNFARHSSAGHSNIHGHNTSSGGLQSHSGSNQSSAAHYLPPARALPPLNEQHALRWSWSLSFAPPRARDVHTYETSMTSLCHFSTVEQFWAVYSHIKRPSRCEPGTDFYLFKKGIRPMWEDPQNADGGRIVFRVSKSRSTRCWEELVLAVIGGKLQPSDQICGLVIGVRFPSNKNPQGGEDAFAIWTKNSCDRTAIDKLTSGIRILLRLPDHVSIEYKEHDSAKKKALEIAQMQAEKKMQMMEQQGNSGTNLQEHI